MNEDAPPASGPQLPFRAEAVLSGGEVDAVALEEAHGNTDLVRVFDALGIAGPFRRLSPWELEDPRGRHLVHAGGYAALGVPADSPGELLLFSFQSFITFVIGPAPAESFSVRLLSSAQGFLGAFLVALFVFALTRSVDR